MPKARWRNDRCLASVILPRDLTIPEIKGKAYLLSPLTLERSRQAKLTPRGL
jgi:hypothetical protein